MLRCAQHDVGVIACRSGAEAPIHLSIWASFVSLRTSS